MRLWITLFLTTALLAQSNPVERVPWSKTTERFAGLEVEVKQVDGKHYKGSWVGVEGDYYSLKTKSRVERLARSEIKTVHAMRR